MKVKNVVKVMNFHSLLRVDKARKDAEKYFAVEKELRTMIASITNNRNYVLDKRLLMSDNSKPALNIYIGSDMGFVGGYNYNVNSAAKKDSESDKIIIGHKIYKTMSNVKLYLSKKEYQENPLAVSEFIDDAVVFQKYSEINVLYNNYVNTSKIEWIKKRIFPFDLNSDEFKTTYTEDFVCESDIDELLINMIATYVDFEVQITVKNSLASENIMRQNSTSQSLKKIEEMEETKSYADYKEKMQKNSQKTIDSFAKVRSLGDEA